MRLIFAGTPEFAVPSLEALIASGHDIVGVFCQPDRRAGRGRRLRACPVKQLALAHRLPVHQPASLRPAETRDMLRELAPDLMLVAAYGLILPQAVLDIPRRGCVNIHASLLPRWRGAAPIARALEAGDRETGICLMQMDAGLDTGPILARVVTPIDADDTAATLHDRLAVIGGELLAAKLAALLDGTIEARPQGETGVTYAAKLSKDEAAIDWQQSADVIERRVRAFYPWPIAHTWHGAARLRVLAACVSGDRIVAPPGTVERVAPDGVVVACGDAGTLRLTRLQRDGGRPLAAAEFLRGHAILAGERLCSAAPV